MGFYLGNFDVKTGQTVVLRHALSPVVTNLNSVASRFLGKVKRKGSNSLKKPSRFCAHVCVPSRALWSATCTRPPPAILHTPSCHAREKSPSLPAPNSPNTEILPNSPSFQASRHGFLSTQKATPPTRDVELWMASSVADPPFQGRPRATSATFARQVALEKSCCPSPTPSYKAVLCVR